MNTLELESGFATGLPIKWGKWSGILSLHSKPNISK